METIAAFLWYSTLALVALLLIAGAAGALL
jgi:hypothetical protein